MSFDQDTQQPTYWLSLSSECKLRVKIYSATVSPTQTLLAHLEVFHLFYNVYFYICLFAWYWLVWLLKEKLGQDGMFSFVYLDFWVLTECL